MLSFDLSALTPLWHAFEARLPEHPDSHPWGYGCHNPRTEDITCFAGVMFKHATGMSWDDVASMLGVSRKTLTRRREHWEGLGVIEHLFAESVRGLDRLHGLDLTHVSVDGSLQKAPGGGEGTGPSPVDRAKLGWKWSILTDRRGILLGCAVGPANMSDLALLEETLLSCPEEIRERITYLHLDKGYDATSAFDICTKLGLRAQIKRKSRRRSAEQIATARAAEVAHKKAARELRKAWALRGVEGPGVDEETRGRVSHTLGKRWPVERTNAWITNFRQCSRSTDRASKHREWWLLLAGLVVHVGKLVKLRRIYGHPEQVPQALLAWKLTLEYGDS